MYRIDVLLKLDRKLFHTQDLALIWGIVNKNTLYTTIKRYLDRGILIPIHKGFYSTIPVNRIDPWLLGISYLHRYAYVSCETILIKEGVIFQSGNYITLVSDVSLKFKVAGFSYLVRKMQDRYLYDDSGIKNVNGVFVADRDRAVKDMLYFNPSYHFDNNYAHPKKRRQRS